MRLPKPNNPPQKLSAIYENVTGEQQPDGLLEVAMWLLPASRRKPVGLKMKGFSYRQIARAMGIKAPSVLERVRWAMKAVKVMLDDGEVHKVLQQEIEELVRVANGETD